ncbi:MAG: ABC transporter permease, partial [Oscillospiraceae bacterium]|nr:ABC transporter permease [Oscillospiraceae bacterium]
MKNLLKKELSELLNQQMLLGLVVSFILIVLLGFIMTSTVSESMETSGEVHIIDQDQTGFTQQIADYLEEQGYLVKKISENAENSENPAYETILKEQNWKEAVVLPSGLMDQLFFEHESCELHTIRVLATTSTVAMMDTGASSAELVRDAISVLLTKNFLGESMTFLENPVTLTSYTVANGKTVRANSFSLVSSMAMFDQLMPLILFMLIILTSQTIITAIGSEKTDKTLETLLSSPVPRSVIIGAKMLAALIVALIYAAVYGIGFATSLLFTVDRTAENVNISEAFSEILATQQATQTLGLQISGIGWVGVILQLLLTIGIALTISTILGGFVEDAKSSQTASLPILILTMFPYILSMISDIRNMELPVRILLYLIPFTHTFTATGCLRFGQTGTFLGGMIYQAVFLAGMIFCALKLYQSDILFVHSLRKKSVK